MTRTVRPIQIAPGIYAALLAGEAMFFVFVGLVIFSVMTPHDLIGLTDTEYAPGFSRGAFRRITAGDTDDRVLAALGEPIQPHRVRKEHRWIWSDPGSVHRFVVFRHQRPT